jgi:hypothetical protein
MIDWSRREHRRQLETIQQVLTMLQERIDASSRAFHYVVRLHDAMQEIIRLHTGIHNRPWLAGSWRLAIRAPPGGVRAFCDRTRRSDRRGHDCIQWPNHRRPTASQMTISKTMPVIPMLTTSCALLHQGRSLHGLLKKMPPPLGLFVIPVR